MRYEFDGMLWRYPGAAGWHFITVPAECTEELRSLRDPAARGFGSLRVEATIGSSSWRTSLFPDTRSGSFLLPVRKDVRVKQRLEADRIVHCSLLVDPTGQVRPRRR